MLGPLQLTSVSANLDVNTVLYLHLVFRNYGMCGWVCVFVRVWICYYFPVLYWYVMCVKILVIYWKDKMRIEYPILLPFWLNV